MRHIFQALALAASLIAGATQGLAQDEQPAEQAPPAAAKNFGPRKGAQAAQPQAETVATHGSWQVQCANQPTSEEQGAPQVRQCGMIQSTKSEKNANIGLSVIVSKMKKEKDAPVVMRVLVPIGVYLPTGIPIEIDGGALPNRMVFTRCTPRLCEAFGEASADSLGKFLKGNDAVFYLYDRPGNGYPMKISLQGFAAALGELDKQ